MHQNNRTGYAIVGCGRIGTRHAEQVVKFGNLVGVCDINAEASGPLASRYDVDTETDYKSFLQTMRGKADVVAICTPNHLHAAHAVMAFDAGFHVICEKPMALNVHECGEMIKAGERANRRLFVVKQNRYNPPIAHLKKLLDSGALGRVYSVGVNCFWNRGDHYYKDTWKGKIKEDGGTLYTQFSHFIDIVYWLVGDVRDVAAFAENYAHTDSVEFEDTVVAIMRFHNGTIGTLNTTINSYGKNMEGSIVLFCERGTIKIGGQYLNEIEYESIEGDDPTILPQGRPANRYGDYEGTMSNHEDVYRNVDMVLSGGGSINTVGFEGMKTVEIIDKIYRAVAAS